MVLILVALGAVKTVNFILNRAVPKAAEIVEDHREHKTLAERPQEHLCMMINEDEGRRMAEVGLTDVLHTAALRMQRRGASLALVGQLHKCPNCGIYQT